MENTQCVPWGSRLKTTVLDISVIQDSFVSGCELTQLSAPQEVSVRGWSDDPESAWWLVGSWQTYPSLQSPTHQSSEPQRCTSTENRYTNFSPRYLRILSGKLVDRTGNKKFHKNWTSADIQCLKCTIRANEFVKAYVCLPPRATQGWWCWL